MQGKIISLSQLTVKVFSLNETKSVFLTTEI